MCVWQEWPVHGGFFSFLFAQISAWLFFSFHSERVSMQFLSFTLQRHYNQDTLELFFSINYSSNLFLERKTKTKTIFPTCLLVYMARCMYSTSAAFSFSLWLFFFFSSFFLSFDTCVLLFLFILNWLQNLIRCFQCLCFRQCCMFCFLTS